MPSRTYSVFGGRLARHAKNDWRWSDGTPEPAASDLSPSQQYNYRVSAGKFVEVLLRDCHAQRDVLGWVLEGVESGKYRQADSGDHTGPMMISDEGVSRMMIEPGEDPLLGNEPIVRKRAIPKVVLVPVAEWDAWSEDHPYGATWDVAEEERIFAKAESLGWRRE